MNSDLLSEEETKQTNYDLSKYPFVFTVDYLREWKEELDGFLSKIDKLEPYNILEIGCFQGKTTVYLANSFPNRETRITAVDTFEGSYYQTENQKRHMYELFKHNILPIENKIKYWKMCSENYFNMLNGEKYIINQYDIIYYDGDTRTKEMLKMLIYMWKFLSIGGYLIVTKYNWKYLYNGDDNRFLYDEKSMRAINIFIDIWENEMEIIQQKGLFICRKL